MSSIRSIYFRDDLIWEDKCGFYKKFYPFSRDLVALEFEHMWRGSGTSPPWIQKKTIWKTTDRRSSWQTPLAPHFLQYSDPTLLL